MVATIQARWTLIPIQFNNRWLAPLKRRNLIKYIFCPAYRRSCQAASYIRRGYNAQQALAKVGVIEA